MYTDSNKFNQFEDLYNAIDMGLDIVFYLYGVRYNISWEDYKPYISICETGKTSYFDNTQDLLDNYKVKGKPFKNLWQDIEIDYM